MSIARRALTLALCLLASSCGCGSDSSLTILTPVTLPAVAGIKTRTPPIPVTPPPVDPTPIPIDITFVLDDSESMNQAWLGIIPSNPLDRRPRSYSAQKIMENLEAQIRTRLAAQYLADGVPVPALDFAFAVARYEDFGGPFTNPNRRLGPVEFPGNDMDARPFILNMPILRRAHPNFLLQFADALAREAPGDGNPRYVSSTGTAIAVDDAQSALEALYQIAAPQNGDGTYGGFDANGNGSTLDSGAPTAVATQTAPGESGDVPAIGFLPLATPDPDDRPQFVVIDEAGTPVEIPDGAGGTMQSLSSGNIGGVGWREGSVRFVILASDIATVTPTETTPSGTPEVPGFLPPPCINVPSNPEPCVTETVSSTTGEPAAPREARTVLLRALDGPPQVISGFVQVTQRRTGVADGPVHDGGLGIAPVGAHTVQETVAALNGLNIEVLLMGTPCSGGLDTKPGEPGVNGDIDSDISSTPYDPSNPETVQSSMAPWFWFNAVTRLTMPEVTSIAEGGGEALFPAVYNLATVWPYDPAADPSIGNLSTIRNTVTDDVIERIRDWVDNGYVQEGGGEPPPPRPPLPTVFYAYQLDVSAETGSLVQVAPLEAGVPITRFRQVVQIPTYWSDETPPADVVVAFPLPTQAPLTYLPIDDSIPLPASADVAFDIEAHLDRLEDTTPENAEQQAQILAWIQARGDGAVPPAPLASPFDPYTQGAGSFRATARLSTAPGPSAELLGVTAGCAVLNDLGAGQDGSDQAGGTCPFPPPPPTLLQR